MKKSMNKNKKGFSQRSEIFSQNDTGREKTVDSTRLRQDIPEEFRDPQAAQSDNGGQAATTENWSQSQDRGEDLVNERDPFLQQPERDTEIPPELIQQRAYLLYERGEHEGDNLADWFEAERQLREEISG